MKTRHPLMAASALAILLQAPLGATAAPSHYWTDSKGQVVRDGSGNCVIALHHGADFPECRGVVAAAEPEPAPAPLAPPAPPAPRDSDGDGVTDALDLCPGTVAGAPVNATGCTEALIVEDLTFASNRAELTGNSTAILDTLVAKIKGNPAIDHITITGHTDAQGAADYNQQLSENRANTVRDYFIANGIDGAMLTAVGMGEAQPIADNATREGRAQNRRVELDFRMK